MMMVTGSQSARDLLCAARQLLEDEHAFAAAEIVGEALDALDDRSSRVIAARMSSRRFGHAPIRLSAYRSCA
ncbi:MAG: hypothetical protein QM681_02185 [Novosphingobium sp.]